MNFGYEPVSGEEITPCIPELSHLRISIFREYPYLYDGDLDYESQYLSRYTKSSRSLVVLMKHRGAIVGATTCLPLEDEINEFREPFERAGYDVKDIFYFGESIILPEFRGQGAGKAFFRFREDHAARGGDFKYTTFCAVDRPEDHPERPANYRPLSQFWERMGYQKSTALRCELPWKEVGSSGEIPHQLTFWIKTH
ncbi:MAG: GNAT family N-acetyltransferase [Verrucomicrobiales bacterium]|nr:GNAT family N-acetyltransferase [Verrucomicrobiales bacterium]